MAPPGPARIPEGAAGKTHVTMADMYLALLHHPVYDKEHRVVTSSVTNMDIHDIARSAHTYGVKRYYVVNPVPTLHALAEKILDHWRHGYGSTYNATRKDALACVALANTLQDTIESVRQEAGQLPYVVATTARTGQHRVRFAEMRRRLEVEDRAFLFLLGTGWGLTEAVLAGADAILEPIQGSQPYNHLSVRSAAAVLLDRLRGAR